MSGIPLRGRALGSAEQATETATLRGTVDPEQAARYHDALYTYAAQIDLNADVLVAQWDLETDRGRDPDWTETGNPAGLGVFSDGTTLGYDFTPTEAALAHVAHMALYVGIPIPESWREADPRYEAAVAAGFAGSVTTTADLGNGRWAEDPDYGDKLEARYRAYWGVYDPDQEEESVSDNLANNITDALKSAMPAMRAHRWPGLKRSAYLPAWIPVEVRISTSSRTRSFQKYTHQTLTTVHDTGNPRTKAAGELSWLLAGRPGGGKGGYNWINDDGIIYITGPFDEETWHAGTPRGNRVSWAGELAYGGNTVWETALEIACAMHGAVIEAQGLNPDEAAVLHQYWYGKWCAAQVLNRGIWDYVCKKIARYARLAAAARAGTTIDPSENPDNVYADPRPLRLEDGTLWDGKEDAVVNGTKYEAQRATVKTAVELRRRQWAITDAMQTGPPLPAGTEVEVLGWVAGELVGQIGEWAVDAEGNRLWVGGLEGYEPKTDPDYGADPELPPGAELVNGRLYYPLYPDDLTKEEWEALDGNPPELGRRITVARDGNLRRWADSSTEATGEVSAGEERIFKYYTRGEALPLWEGGPEERIWFTEELHAGSRMWAGLSKERPD